MVAAPADSVQRLRDGARIAVIGAGPAGNFFAHFARRLAAQAGVRIHITIFDGKDFARRGPAGCNMGAGVVSERLAARMAREGIVLPEDRVQRRIGGYYLQTRNHGFLLTHPTGKREISAFFRGGGPRYSSLAYNVSFDEFLSELVVREGGGDVELVREPVTGLTLPRRPEEKVQLSYGRGAGSGTLEADLVVGAFGLNSSMATRVADLGFGYRPPRTIRACQTELTLDPAYIERVLGGHIHTFVLSDSAGAWFGVLTPKATHVTVTVVGRRDLRLEDLEEFLRQPVVRERLPAEWEFPRETCICFPRLAVSAAQHPYADRLVIVGDASYCRYYKNGFQSAFVTSRLAAETAFQRGISAEAFARGYAGRAESLLVRDNAYGRLLYALNDFVSRHDSLAELRKRVATSPPADAAARRLRWVLWGMVTGDLSYRHILLASLHPELLGGLARAAAGQVIERATKVRLKFGGKVL